MIIITKEPNADSRTAPRDITIEELEQATRNHISHVRDGMSYLSSRLMCAGLEHDRTKLDDLQAFYDSFTRKKLMSGWYKRHVTEERHHILSREPKDVNLIDVIEHLTDAVMAGLSRSGEVWDITPTNGLLYRAHRNTIELLKNNIIVEG